MIKTYPFQGLVDFLESGEGVYLVHGLKGSTPAYMLAQAAARTQIPFLIVTPSEEEAERVFQELQFFTAPGRNLLLYPAWDIKPFEKISPTPEVIGQRWTVRHRLLTGSEPAVVVASLPALLPRVPPREVLRRFALSVSSDREIQRDELISRLEETGYTRVNLVTEVGEFAVRGYLVDVFSPAHALPVRLEFFGDRIDSLRSFDPETQRSSDVMETATILPAREVLFHQEFMAHAAEELAKRERDPSVEESAGEVREKIREGIALPGIEFYEPLFYSSLESFFDYLPSRAAVFFQEPPEIEDAGARFREEAQENRRYAAQRGEFWPAPEELYLTDDDFRDLAETFPRVLIQSIEMGGEQGATGLLRVQTESNERLRSDLLASKSPEGILELLAQRIRAGRDKGQAALIVCSGIRSAQRLQEMLEHHGLSVRILTKAFPVWVPEDSAGADVTLLIGAISRGFVFPQGGLFLIAESELFGEKHPRRRRAVPLKDHALASFSELQTGDYVVHTDHGIGVYRGLLKLMMGEEEHEFLLLEYQGGDKLYLPVYRLNLVQKYVGGDGGPRLDKLGGTSWETAKKRVKRSLRELAEELVRLYAARQVVKGHAFKAGGGEYLKEFEAAFEYEETPDQMQAIEDVQNDMTSEKPMDRLVCGDVGFGKTEVALRAAFRAMMEGKQVAVLVPTTVLAQQHYQTFSRRLAPYPLRVEMLSRFRTRPEQKGILQDLVQGKVDLLVGTHRLLQRDVEFKDLGLLIVDEEHRFGVTHKEKLKRLRTNVDVLTLTATPIPRTLQMSLGGIRDLSVIETPPEERLPIRTYVLEFDEEVIRDAVRRELRRGGQVFFVHNRIQSIPSIDRLLRRLVPEARVAIAHGQMVERDLEKIMLAFVRREIDVLLTTTIIESGLDFPAANTIIINRADKLGLAQMYQLRGRVGRSRERAYAYLIVPPLATMGTDARKRIQALQEVTELGSGLKLAMHDLEIRGAGTLLGDAQSGHVAAVGFDMYMQILEQAVQELKGEEVVEEVEPEIDLPVPALIPADYVEDINQRLLFYRRLSTARSDEDVAEVAAELRDRYGPFPAVLENLLDIMKLRLILKAAGVRRISSERDRVVLAFDARSPIDIHRLVELISSADGKFELTPDQRLRFRIKDKGWRGMLDEARKILGEIL